MRPGKLSLASLAPIAAVVLAVAYLAAALWPPLLAVVVVAATVAACTLVLGRRPSRLLGITLTAVATWLVLGLAGAFVLSGRVLGGFAWVLLVLYGLPLPLIPWLYLRTFASPADDGAGVFGSQSPIGSDIRRAGPSTTDEARP